MRKLTCCIGTTLDGSTAGPGGEVDSSPVSADHAARTVQQHPEVGLDVDLAGGGRPAWSLAAEIDELAVEVHPVLAGAGVRSTAGRFALLRWRLTGTETFDSGAVVLSCAR